MTRWLKIRTRESGSMPFVRRLKLGQQAMNTYYKTQSCCRGNLGLPGAVLEIDADMLIDSSSCSGCMSDASQGIDHEWAAHSIVPSWPKLVTAVVLNRSRRIAV
jgi:hypothetical protein